MTHATAYDFDVCSGPTLPPLQLPPRPAPQPTKAAAEAPLDRTAPAQESPAK